MEAIVTHELALAEIAQSDYERERGKPMPSLNHAVIQARISQQLLNGYEDVFTIGSELSLIATSPPTVPDLCIYPEIKLNWLTDEVKVSRVPLTVVEILSPSQTITELTEKSQAFFAIGVQSYWLVQPAFRSVIILQPNADELVFHNERLTDPTNGISIDLKKIFR
jgi:Uma2 family endonuclease